MKQSTAPHTVYCRPVRRTLPDGTEPKDYRSMTEAANELDTAVQGVDQSAKSGVLCKGYRFEYTGKRLMQRREELRKG